MKKVLLIAVLAIFGLSANAQLNLNRTFAQKKSSTTWILRAGANFAGVTGDGAEDLGSKTGYDVAISFQKPLSDFGMFWGMELGVGTRGYSFDNTEYNEYYEENYISEGNALAHNVRFSPFTFGYAYSINDDIKIDAHLGAWVSYDFAGDYSWTKGWESDEPEEDSTSLSDLDGYQALDYGMTLGVGVWYKRLNLDLSWKRGFNDVIEDGKIQSSDIMLRLGVAF